MKQITAHDVFGNPYKVNVDSLEIAVHVYGIAVNDGKVLISPQWDGFDFPGGTANKGETHIETLKREFREETGYEVKPLELLSFHTTFFRHHKRDVNYQSYLVFYRVKIVGGGLTDVGFDTDEKEYARLAKWVPLEDLKMMHHVCSANILDELISKL